MSFEKLRVYQAAELMDQQVTLLITRIPAGKNPRDLKQLERACPSVQYNIAEAFGSEHVGQKINHLGIARGSVDETRSILRKLSKNGTLAPKEVQQPCALAIVIAKMLTAWIDSLSA